jgi:hypothetical protein
VPAIGKKNIMRTTPSSTTPPLVKPELGIWFDGRAYHYQQYRYDRLQDAVAYAKIDRSRPGFHAQALPLHWEEWREPDDAETVRMAVFGITYENGRYSFGPFRYDFLDDAVDYAKRAPAPPASR